MYDSASTAAANDRFWALIRDALRTRDIAAPEALTRGALAYLPGWLSSDLVFAQCCGYPFRARLLGRVTLIGAADHGLPGCPPGHYNSVLVAREDDPRRRPSDFDGAGFAWNEDLSQSGWAAAAHLARRQGIRLNPVFRSGGHRASARALREAKADFAAIDALTWAMMQEDGSGDAEGLKEITRTEPTPALPFIAGKALDHGAVFVALAEAIARLDDGDRARLHLKGLVRLSEADYLAVPDPGLHPDPPARPPGAALPQ